MWSIGAMSKNDPVAFLSYVRSDDEHDGGRITELRQRLEGEVKMQTGLPFHIFQDRNDIRWGHQWKERLEDALMSVTFLIPIVTPSFFRSNACRDEFDTFISREQMLGENQLILPVYYANAPQFEGDMQENDEIAKNLKSRNWADWRDYRFDSLMDPRLRGAVASLAGDIVGAMDRLNAVLDAAQEIPSTIKKRQRKSALKTKAPMKSLTEASDMKSQGTSNTHKGVAHPKATHYHVFTKEFDEVIHGGELLTKTSAFGLHSLLLDHVRKGTEAVGQSALTSFSDTLRQVGRDQNICVTLLLDNSGSLRGGPNAVLAAWSSVFSRVLSEEEIPNEVLGFTTRAWKGGQSREVWLATGRLVAPGRLNDLRHIVYKTFDQTFQEADIHFSAMLQEGLLKENIDGEALLWASDRIISRPEKRKLIIVLSDGAPVDDSTLASNDTGFLSSHLEEVVCSLRAANDIEVYGVGLDQDVSRYYGASPIISLENLGADFLTVTSSAIRNDWDEAVKIQRPIPKKHR
jgi:hypothetical protein